MLEFIHCSPPNAERRACEDCRWLRGAVSLWCTNEAACIFHGTAIPGATHCKFWKPGRTAADVGRLERWFSPRLIWLSPDEVAADA